LYLSCPHGGRWGADLHEVFSNFPEAALIQDGQSLGSTGSLSRARTPKTHSWTR